jgi:hypothetical protein
MAKIIIRRKSSMAGCAQSHNVYLLNTFVGELKNGGVLEIPVEVGTHMLSLYCMRTLTNLTHQNMR